MPAASGHSRSPLRRKSNSGVGRCTTPSLLKVSESVLRWFWGEQCHSPDEPQRLSRQRMRSPLTHAVNSSRAATRGRGNYLRVVAGRVPKAVVKRTRAFHRPVDELFRVTVCRLSRSRDFARRQLFEVAETKDFSIGGRQQHEHALDQKFPVQSFDRVIVRRFDGDACCRLDAIQFLRVTPVRTAAVAHRSNEPRLRVVNLNVSREEGKQRFLHERFDILFRNAELSARNVRKELPVLKVERLRVTRDPARVRR